MGLMRKDVRLAEALADQLGVDAPALARIAEIWRASSKRFPDDVDFNAIGALAPNTSVTTDRDDV